VPAWVPVTITEWLAYREREAVTKVEDLTRQLSEVESSVERYQADMARQIAQAPDAVQKAELRRAMDENTATLRAATAQGRTELTRLLREAEAALQGVRDERARLSPAQLAEQARLDRTPLVKVNPALQGGSGRVTLIVVHAAPNRREMGEPLEQAVREMDYAALRQLLR
jgi:hypothetical protein